MEKGNVYFGIRQALKNSKKKNVQVFVVKDARAETIEKLEEGGLELDFLKGKEDVRKELDLDFYCEVFSIVEKGKGGK